MVAANGGRKMIDAFYLGVAFILGAWAGVLGLLLMQGAEISNQER